MNNKIIFYILLLFFITIGNKHSHAKVVEYKLNISGKTKNISDKAEVNALVVNDSIPGPTLKAEIGDTLRVTVHNKLDMDSSIHWHGVLVPNNMDGVPYINQPPIRPGETFVYEFPIKHSGTYWYHAHSSLQEQQGVYGGLAFYDKNQERDYDEEHVVVLSDWTDEDPDSVLANLKKDPDYYALKKDSVQSWFKVLENGTEAVKIRIKNAWSRMGPMDISDIGYDAFLMNGKKSSILSHAKKGKRIKLRVINAAASSYFVLEYAGGPMIVIESDGVKVSPFTAQRIRLAMAETYNVIITVPENKTYELRASAEDGTGYAVAHIGRGDLTPTPAYLKPNLTLMDMSSDHGAMGGHEMGDARMSHTSDTTNHALHQGSNLENKAQSSSQKKASEINTAQDHSMHGETKTPDIKNKNPTIYKTPGKATKALPHVNYLNNYKPIKSLTKTLLPKHQPIREVTLKLTGSMERYVWTINDTPMYAADEIVINKGENVKFILVNETMMNHPIHVHGHFFRVLNGQGEYSPLKHTVNVSPFETLEIEFDANEEKDWIFHCHNLYHMKLGMGGVIHYQGTKHDPAIKEHAHEHSSEHGDLWFNATSIHGNSNFGIITTKFMHNNDNFIADYRHNYKKDYEGELIYKRYISQFLGLYAGARFEHEHGKTLKRGILGLEYTIPLLIKTDLRINTKRKLRFGLGNEHQLTDRMSFDWHWNTHKEYTLELNYAITKQLYISGNYDSKERFGLGLNLRF